MVAALLAIASSLSWGLSDFLGGLLSRRHHLVAVMLLSQGVALVILVAAVLLGAPTEHDAAATAWAAGVGGLGLLGLIAFYRALSIGTMSIVAPISATGVDDPRAGRARLGRAARSAPDGGHAARLLRRRAGRARAAGRRRRGAPHRRAPRSGWRCWRRSASARSSPGSTGPSRPPTSPGCCSRRARPTSRCSWRRRRWCGRGSRPRRARSARSPRSASSTCSRTSSSCSRPGAGC